MLTLNDGRSELWQWDTKRKLTVDADCSQVHFSNKVFGRSIDMDVMDGLAIIPDILLQTDKDLFAWAFVGTAENGYTKISKVFKVNKRNKPADYVFTPPEQTTLEEIMERLDDIESAQDTDAIKNAVDDYLANNPIKVNETDPTVSDWAKRPEKPSYTADEVGALSKTELSGAVNDALAQAKESGEFDGEPGEPGHDYVLTDADKAEIAEMAAGLVEIPEGSGGGIAVTGAKIGQTIKISAVDDEGRPTAWEAVDLPAGGSGEWKHIRTVVLAENVSSIAITTDKDGNPFEFDEIAIRSVTMTGDEKKVYSGAIWINGADGNASKNALYYNFQARHPAGYFSPTVAHLHPFCGHFAFNCWYHDGGIPSADYLSKGYTSFDSAISTLGQARQPSVLFNYSTVNSAFMYSGTAKATKITAVTYGAPFADHMMAAGSIFEFYGR